MTGKRKRRPISEAPPPSAKRRDGVVITMGDEVTTNFHPSCEGQTFIVCEINPYLHCESGNMVVTHLKGNQERKIKGLQVQYADGSKIPDGIDTNWYLPVNKNKIS